MRQMDPRLKNEGLFPILSSWTFNYLAFLMYHLKYQKKVFTQQYSMIP